MFSYEFAAALASSRSEDEQASKRVYDKLRPGFTRPRSELVPIVGLFNGNVCRRCDAVFNHPEFDRNEHREWHEWKDENTRCDEVSPELERLCYDGDGFLPPKLAELERHRVRFMPKGVTFKNRRADHSAAVDDVIRIYGLALSASDLDAEILRLSETMPTAEVARCVGKSSGFVLRRLRNTRKRGSATSTSRNGAA